jgi:hypothetical protein
VAGQTLHVELLPPAGKKPSARATVAVNSLGVIDLLEIAVAGLQPGQEYQLFLVDSLMPDASRIPLAKFKTWPNGAAVAQAIGPLRTVVAATAGAGDKQPEQRYLVVTAIGSDQPVLQQRTQ